MPQGEPGGERRRDDRSNVEPDLAKRVAERPLTSEQVLMEGLADCRHAARLGRTEHRSAPQKPRQAPDESRRDTGERPQPDPGADAAVESEAVNQQAGERRGDRVGDGECRQHPAVAGVGEPELRAQQRRQRGQDLAIQIVQDG